MATVDRLFEKHLLNPGQLTQLLNSDQLSGYTLFPTRQELKEISERFKASDRTVSPAPSPARRHRERD